MHDLVTLFKNNGSNCWPQMSGAGYANKHRRRLAANQWRTEVAGEDYTSMEDEILTLIDLERGHLHVFA